MSAVQPVSVQGKVRRFCNDGSRQNSLELRPGFKPLHWRAASVQEKFRMLLKQSV
jgi:hypothetical protein